MQSDTHVELSNSACNWLKMRPMETNAAVPMHVTQKGRLSQTSTPKVWDKKHKILTRFVDFRHVPVPENLLPIHENRLPTKRDVSFLLQLQAADLVRASRDRMGWQQHELIGIGLGIDRWWLFFGDLVTTHKLLKWWGASWLMFQVFLWQLF